MADYTLEPIGEGDAKRWDELVEASNDGTLFHRLSFLAYHGERFRDQVDHQFIVKGETPVGVFPVAVFDTEDGVEARSPYGGSYGGPALPKPPSYRDSRRIVDAILAYLKEGSIDRCTLRLPTLAHARTPSDTFKLALHDAGFELVTRDIVSMVRLNANQEVGEIMGRRGRRGAGQAEKQGITAERGVPLDDFWRLMEITFSRHGTDPTHSKEELEWLVTNLPDRVRVDVAYDDGVPAAGMCIMNLNEQVTTSFYLVDDHERRDLAPQPLLIRENLRWAMEQGIRWFSFGTSSVEMEPRENLFRFKEGFGALGRFRETFSWSSA